MALSGKGTVPAAAPTPAAIVAPAPAPVTVKVPVLAPLSVKGLRVPSRLRLRVARHAGIAASFTAPAGATVARLRLLKAGARQPVASKLVVLEAPGRQLVHLRASKARRGRYVLEIAVGASASALTRAATARLTLVR